MMSDERNTVMLPRIESRIQVIRGLRVMLDVDLAALYGVPTKRLNEQVKRNRDRFPGDFLFQLTHDEKAEVVANCDHLQNLTAPPKPVMRPIATNICHVARFADAFQLRQLCRHCHDICAGTTSSTCSKCTKTASPWRNTGPNCLPMLSWQSRRTLRGCFMWSLLGRRRRCC